MKPRKVRIMLDITTEVPLGDIRKARAISLSPYGKYMHGQYLDIDQIQAKVIPSVKLLRGFARMREGTVGTIITGEPGHIKVAKKKGG